MSEDKDKCELPGQCGAHKHRDHPLLPPPVLEEAGSDCATWRVSDPSRKDFHYEPMCDVWATDTDGNPHHDAQWWAERIVACVNACRGVHTKYLKPDSVKELMSALKWARWLLRCPEIAEHLTTNQENWGDPEEVMRIMDSALSPFEVSTEEGGGDT